MFVLLSRLQAGDPSQLVLLFGAKSLRNTGRQGFAIAHHIFFATAHAHNHPTHRWPQHVACAIESMLGRHSGRSARAYVGEARQQKNVSLTLTHWVAHVSIYASEVVSFLMSMQLRAMTQTPMWQNDPDLQANDPTHTHTLHCTGQVHVQVSPHPKARWTTWCQHTRINRAKRIKNEDSDFPLASHEGETPCQISKTNSQILLAMTTDKTGGGLANPLGFSLSTHCHCLIEGLAIWALGSVFSGNPMLGTDSWEGDETKHFSEKNKGFSVKGGEAFSKWWKSTREAIQWRGPGVRATQWTAGLWKLQSCRPHPLNPKISSYMHDCAKRGWVCSSRKFLREAGCGVVTVRELKVGAENCKRHETRGHGDDKILKIFLRIEVGQLYPHLGSFPC